MPRPRSGSRRGSWDQRRHTAAQSLRSDIRGRMSMVLLRAVHILTPNQEKEPSTC